MPSLTSLEDKPGAFQALGLTDQIGFKLRMAQARVWADLVATFDQFELRPHHYGALSIIAARDGCKQQEIGEILGIVRPNLVALVEELSGRGLVNRAVKAADRRSYALSLTPEGIALLSRMNAAHSEHQARVARALAPYDGDGLCRRLDKLLTSDLLSTTLDGAHA